MAEIPTLTITAAPQPDAADPVLEFAAQHIGDAASIEVRVVYAGFEAAPDILTVERSDGGELRVTQARSDDA